MNSEITDEALMQSFMRGDEAAFDALFDRHAALLRRYLVRLVGAAAEADDALQQTFLSVVRARSRFRPNERFKPWLYTIATNVARDTLRKRGSAKTELDAAPESAVAVEPYTPDTALDAEVKKALGALPATQRSAILLHWFEGLSFAEVARVEGASESAVKVRAHRGYEKLKSLLERVWQP